MSRMLSTWLICFFCTATYADSTHQEPTSSTPIIEGKKATHLSCAEVVDIVKQSDCAGLVRPMLEGASVTVGLALQNLVVNVKESNSNRKLGEVRDDATPAPSISLDLRPSYILESKWGWGLGFNYDDAYALNQRITRSGKTEDVDLGSYMTSTMVTVTPNTFYQFGEQYGDEYFRLGIGLALGYASVRGNAYLTEDQSNDACYDAGSDLVNETGSASKALRVGAIKSNCVQETFDEGRFGVGGYFFMQGQYKRWMSSFSIANIALQKQRRKLEPSLISFQVSYVIP